MKQEQMGKKVEKYIKEEERLLKKHKLGREPIIIFPGNKIPRVARLAMWIIRRHKAIIDFQFFTKD